MQCNQPLQPELGQSRVQSRCPARVQGHGLLALPFKGNKLIEGWQIRSIVTANSGILRNTGDLSTYSGRAGSAPTISSLAGTPRQIQFALKLTF
jgi:hypothetical protein